MRRFTTMSSCSSRCQIPRLLSTPPDLHRGPDLSNLSITAVVETLLALFVLPFVAWRRRKIDRERAAGALWLWIICLSVFLTTTLVEAAENNRFRFELGGLPLVGATIAIAWLVDRSGAGGGLVRVANGEPPLGVE